MFDWFYDTYNYFFESYRERNDKVIKELTDNFSNNYNTKIRAEREPILTSLRQYFILNRTRRNAEAKSKLIQCDEAILGCSFCSSKKAYVDLQSYSEIIDNKWYLIGGSDNDIIDGKLYHCLFAGPYNTEQECEFINSIPHVYRIKGSEIMRSLK